MNFKSCAREKIVKKVYIIRQLKTKKIKIQKVNLSGQEWTCQKVENQKIIIVQNNADETIASYYTNQQVLRK